MPSFTFVLPHWMYWGALLLFPLVAMYLVRAPAPRTARRTSRSLFNAYLFWLTSGFMGLHRMYLKSWWGFVYLPFFLAVLYCNGEVRDSARGRFAHDRGARAGADGGQARAADRRRRADARGAQGARRRRGRRARQADRVRRRQGGPGPLEEPRRSARDRRRGAAAGRRVPAAGAGAQAPRRGRRGRLRRRPGRRTSPRCRSKARPRTRRCACARRSPTGSTAINAKAGEYVAYWARDRGLRLLLRGDGALRLQLADQLGAREHVPDVRHAVHDLGRLRLPRRPARARRRLLFQVLARAARRSPTSSARCSSSSSRSPCCGPAGASPPTPSPTARPPFTEWGIQYWPVKLTMPIGAALIMLQGVSKLIKDILILTRKEA